MKNLIAIGLACALPASFAAENTGPAEVDLGMANVLVIEDAPAATRVACVREGDAKDDCMAFNQAVLNARTRKVPALREHGRWI